MKGLTKSAAITKNQPVNALTDVFLISLTSCLVPESFVVKLRVFCFSVAMVTETNENKF